jgi:hypothetical protein
VLYESRAGVEWRDAWLGSLTSVGAAHGLSLVCIFGVRPEGNGVRLHVLYWFP